MKLGVFTPVVQMMSLKEALEYLSSLGVQTVELGAGGYPGKSHLDPDKLLGNKDKIDEIKQLLKDNNIEISALSCHGNPLHPNREIAEGFHSDFVKTLQLANELEVDTVIGFSGCPGDSDNAKYPNWVTCPWPDDFLKVLEYQWEKLIAYWKDTAETAKKYGVKNIAFEMHPGFCVYNPETLLKLRSAVGDIIGANFDPSHLIWQGIDPCEAIRALGRAIYHFHAKDTRVDRRNTAVNGVLDTKGYGDILNRSWVFRTVGYGNDTKYWKDMISMLRTVGYDGAVSIEHEDGLMSAKEGLEKAVEFLKSVLIYETAGEMWWA